MGLEVLYGFGVYNFFYNQNMWFLVSPLLINSVTMLFFAISFATQTPTTLHTALGPQLVLSHGSPLSISVSESALPSRSTVPSVSVGPIDGVFQSDVVGGFFFGVVGSFLAAVVLISCWFR